MTISQDATMFLQRAGLRSTPTHPASSIAPFLNDVYNHPLERPLPLVELLGNEYASPDDRGKTREPWPHGQVGCDI